MNTIFYTKNGQVEEPVSYWNIVRQQVQDVIAELGGVDFNRKTASEYLDTAWRPNTHGINSDEQWNNHKTAVLDEVEKLVEIAKEITP
jgi:hypothetical protein